MNKPGHFLSCIELSIGEGSWSMECPSIGGWWRFYTAFWVTELKISTSRTRMWSVKALKINFDMSNTKTWKLLGWDPFRFTRLPIAKSKTIITKSSQLKYHFQNETIFRYWNMRSIKIISCFCSLRSLYTLCKSRLYIWTKCARVWLKAHVLGFCIYTDKVYRVIKTHKPLLLIHYEICVILLGIYYLYTLMQLNSLHWNDLEYFLILHPGEYES